MATPNKNGRARLREELAADRAKVRGLNHDFPQVVAGLVKLNQHLADHPNALHHIDRDDTLHTLELYHQTLVRSLQDGDPYTAQSTLNRWAGLLNRWAGVVGVWVRLYWHESTSTRGVYTFSGVTLLQGDHPIRDIAKTRLDKRWVQSQIDKGLQSATMGNRLTQSDRGVDTQGRKRIRRR